LQIFILLSVSEIPNPTPQGPSIGITFLYYFAGTALISTFLASQVLHLSLSSGIPNQLGSLMGLVGGLVGTYFNRAMTLEIPMQGKKKLLNQLTPILESMGYALAEEVDQTLVFQRSRLSSLFSGKVYLSLGDQTATITSRAVHIRELKKRLG
jgi:hypothetical protein